MKGQLFNTIIFGLAISMLSSCQQPKEEKLNVVFLAVDDLTSNLASYGDPIAKTPNFDRLAKLGVQFNNAYCQLPLCNPSRASVMTGLRPDQIKVYDLDAYFRDAVPDVTTLPQLFKDNGYWVGRVGKLYHYNVPASIGTNGHDDPLSWQEVYNPKGRDKTDEHLVVNAEPQRKISAALSWLRAEGADEEQTDGMIATEAINQIKKHKDEPFFLAAGFFRPHTPYVAPKKYFDLYPIEQIKIPFAPEDDREDIPYAALAHNCKVSNYGLPDSVCLEAKQAYYATVSFIDAQVGRILDALEENQLMDKTMIVLWSDHGYHLGEHQGIWQKRCLFEESASAPLFIYHPKAKGNGVKSDQIVEFIDMYPTITKAAGFEVPDQQPGKDLQQLLDNPTNEEWNGVAYTQVLRPGKGNPVMGRSVRTNQWRYTDWNEGQEGQELYDHINDPKEFNNLTNNPDHADVVSKMKKLLEQNVSGKIPTSPVNPVRL
ncbi:MAG: sulfatase [Cyclobacteriaceae bacterium]